MHPDAIRTTNRLNPSCPDPPLRIVPLRALGTLVLPLCSSLSFLLLLLHLQMVPRLIPRLIAFYHRGEFTRYNSDNRFPTEQPKARKEYNILYIMFSWENDYLHEGKWKISSLLSVFCYRNIYQLSFIKFFIIIAKSEENSTFFQRDNHSY